MLTVDINKSDFVTLVCNVLKVEANSNSALSTVAPRASTVISAIKIWADSPLNPLNSSFSKALWIERTFKETPEIKTFNLEREKWITFRNHISAKVIGVTSK